MFIRNKAFMAKVNTNISIDGELKKEAVKLFTSFGLDLSTAITLFLQQAVREQRIPFEIKMEVPNKKTIKALNEMEEVKKNKKKYKRYNSVDEMLKDI